MFQKTFETLEKIEYSPIKLAQFQNNNQISFRSKQVCQNTNGYTLLVSLTFCMASSAGLKKKHDEKSP